MIAAASPAWRFLRGRAFIIKMLLSSHIAMVAVEEGTLERASCPRELAGSRARAGILYSLTLNYMQVRTRASGVLEPTIFHRVCCKRRKLQTGFHLSLTRRGKGEDVEAEVGRSAGRPGQPGHSLVSKRGSVSGWGKLDPRRRTLPRLRR